jgi:methylthioribose-1-phosphate isomerase
LRSTRPTAVNMFWAIGRVLDTVRGGTGTIEALKKLTLGVALRLADEDLQVNLAIGRTGASLLDDGDVVLTHCNAGAFGTVGYGTALGIVKAAVESGKKVRVIATETRPKLQGARLTTFELRRDGIPVTLIVDSAVGYILAEGAVDKVIVGADRVLRDGSVINKIGTYMIGVLSEVHKIPFYVASPLSTIDLKTKPEDVEIELRDEEEVFNFQGIRIAPTGILALNPAFDVTPSRYVTAIVTESGVVFPPFRRNLSRLIPNIED